MALIRGREPRFRLALTPEPRVAQLEWLADAIRDEGIERLAGCDLDHATQNRRRFAVTEACAGVFHQRGFRDVDDELRQPYGSRPHLESAIELRGSMTQAGGMQQQILDRDLAVGLPRRAGASL